MKALKDMTDAEIDALSDEDKMSLIAEANEKRGKVHIVACLKGHWFDFSSYGTYCPACRQRQKHLIEPLFGDYRSKVWYPGVSVQAVLDKGSTDGTM